MSNSYYQKLELQLETLTKKMVEIREELATHGKDYRIVPLSDRDSGVILAVCESLGVDLISMVPGEGSVFIDRVQFLQLVEAMGEFMTLDNSHIERAP